MWEDITHVDNSIHLEQKLWLLDELFTHASDEQIRSLQAHNITIEDLLWMQDFDKKYESWLKELGENLQGSWSEVYKQKQIQAFDKNFISSMYNLLWHTSLNKQYSSYKDSLTGNFQLDINIKLANFSYLKIPNMKEFESEKDIALFALFVSNILKSLSLWLVGQKTESWKKTTLDIKKVVTKIMSDFKSINNTSGRDKQERIDDFLWILEIMEENDKLFLIQYTKQELLHNNIEDILKNQTEAYNLIRELLSNTKETTKNTEPATQKYEKKEVQKDVYTQNINVNSSTDMSIKSDIENQSIKISGGWDVIVEWNIKTNKVKISWSWNISCKNLEALEIVDISASWDIHITGKLKTNKIKLSGSWDITCDELDVSEKIDISWSWSIKAKKTSGSNNPNVVVTWSGSCKINGESLWKEKNYGSSSNNFSSNTTIQWVNFSDIDRDFRVGDDFVYSNNININNSSINSSRWSFWSSTSTLYPWNFNVIWGLTITMDKNETVFIEGNWINFEVYKKWGTMWWNVPGELDSNEKWFTYKWDGIKIVYDNKSRIINVRYKK